MTSASMASSSTRSRHPAELRSSSLASSSVRRVAPRRPTRPRLALKKQLPLLLGLPPLQARSGLGDDTFNSLFSELDSEFNDMFQQSERLQRDAEERLLLGRKQQQSLGEEGKEMGRGRTYKRENSSEEKLQGGGFRKSYFSESVTIYGDTGGGPFVNGNVAAAAASPANSLLVLLPAVLWLSTVLYAAGMAAFYATFDKTSFGTGNRIAFALLWPFLFAFSNKFRTEFRQAIQNNKARRASSGGSDAGTTGEGNPY